MRSIHILIILLAQLPLLAQTKDEKKAAETAVITDRVDTKRFAFRALSAMASGGAGTRQLSGSSYTFTVLPDSIVSDLPYYGRLYQAPMNSQDGGIKFISTKSDYS